MSLIENQVVANQLAEHTAGKRIEKAIMNQNPHTFVWFALEPNHAYCDHAASNQFATLYEELLVGQTIRTAAAHFGAYGTYTFLYIGDRALMFHVPVRLLSPTERVPKRHQLLLELEDGSSLAFTGSLGGALFFFRTDEDGLAIDYKPHGAPSVLSDDFSSEYFLDLIRSTELRKLSAKAFFAAKNRIPGLDNSILQEILWEAQVNPKSKMAALSEDDLLRVFQAIKTVFPAAIALGGLDTQKDIFGNPGDYLTKAGRNTFDKPCGRCGGIITKESYLGGAIYYCPSCQPYKE